MRAMSVDNGARRRRRRAALRRYAVIMAGGHGTRFWPASRFKAPKQLLSITGRHTLLQETTRRLRSLFSWRRMLVVTNVEHAAEVRRQLPRIPAEHILVEPTGRNTAACIALAAEWIATRVGNAVMVALPADHVIKDVDGLQRTLRAAADLAARQHCLVTIGVPPARAETGYGYVEVGSPIAGPTGASFWVRRFHEKPIASVARRYAASGRHLWNAGMFAWETEVFQRALDLCLPEVRGALKGVFCVHPDSRQGRRVGSGRRRGRDAGARSASALRVRRAYRRLPSVSVDVGIMERIVARRRDAPRVAVVRASFDWNDVGSWVAMPEVWGCDKLGNASLGKVLPVDAADSIVYSPGRLVALVGVKGLIVVDSPDALLICARDRAQDVRTVPHELKARGWSRYV
jgi:mannose-1-phosphate guanylyltransferase